MALLTQSSDTRDKKYFGWIKTERILKEEFKAHLLTDFKNVFLASSIT